MLKPCLFGQDPVQWSREQVHTTGSDRKLTLINSAYMNGGRARARTRTRTHTRTHAHTSAHALALCSRFSELSHLLV
jgi:hypothetical protein